ncbi:MAG: hypothetical protein N2320_04440 [Candidatus Bipolaricaulota bacterium]|nr:hypothetical protein [Candidatus Bipolaricaulota bacterium]
MLKYAVGITVAAVLALSGCSPLSPPTELFPEEIAPGWSRAVEAPIPAGELPEGVVGGRAALWRSGEAWIWAEVVTAGDAAAARELFQDAVASFAPVEVDTLGDEGVRLLHPPTGLGLHAFRVGPSVALVGSLARGPAPDPALVRQAALALARRLPDREPPVGSGPAPEPPAQTPRVPVELEVELRAPDGTVGGRLTIRVYGSLLGESGGICRYRLRFHLGKIVLGQVPPDGPFRGPLDLFLGVLLELPCGRVTVVTPELAHLRPGEAKVFDEPGPLLAELICPIPCWRPDLPVHANAVLRDSDADDFLDLLRGFVAALPRGDPRTAELGEVVEELVRAHGLPRREPADPMGTAEGVRGTTVGGGSARGDLPLEEWYGGIKLEFSGTLAIAGSCSRPAEDMIHCRVPEGATGTLTLEARRTPAGAVHLRAESLPPGWPPFSPRSGWGTVTAPYAFPVPPGTAGRRFELRFKAWTAGVIGELELRVILDVVPAEGLGSVPELAG